MATISISYDTKTKKKKVMMDNKEMKNIASVAIYNYGDAEDRLEITSLDTNEEEGIYTTHRIYCADGQYDIIKCNKKEVDINALSEKLGKQLQVK